MATTVAYQTGQVFTEAGPEGKWQTEVMAPVTGASDTVTENAYGLVDGQGRPAVAYVSAARTTDQTSGSFYSRGAAGLIATLVVTAKTSSPSITFSIQAYDPASATWITLLTSAAITNTSTNRLTVSPQVSSSANVSVNGVIPDTVRIFVDHSNTDSITYSVGLDWTP